MNRDNNRKLVIAVLSVSVISILGSTAVSPALSGIKNAFPQYSDAWIQMVLTLPILFIIPSCLACRFAVEKYGQKKVLLFGIIIYLIGGIGAGLMPDFYGMLVMRGVLGVGCGLITPLAQSLISSNFQGRLRERLTAYSASASYLMGVMAAFLVGKLVGVNWKLSFGIYLVAVIVMLLNMFFLPSQEPLREEKNDCRQKINHHAYGTILCMMFINMAFYTFSASISLFMRQESIGDETTSGIVVSAFMVFGFLIGLIVTEIRKLLKEYTMVLGCIMMGGGYFGLSVATSLQKIIISAALIGGSYSILYYGIFSKIRELSRSKAENTKLITYTTAGMFFGQAVSQQLLRLVEVIAGISGYRFRFLFIAIMLGISVLISVSIKKIIR